jgi:two-component system response regulator HydG
MVVQDQDGVLNLDDLQDGDTLHGLPDHKSTSPGSLVGRPLTEVERYYMQQALHITDGNREEAARMLGIGERTLYRNMQEWKLQDSIKTALHQSDGNLEKAAELLKMKPTLLERKIKKWGLQNSGTEEDAKNPPAAPFRDHENRRR